MELEEILIENFGTIERIKLTLNTPGMTLITGLNKDAPRADSNGAGKSLLLDAICWCLWGQTVRGLTTDDVVRRQVGQDCCVTTKLKDGKNTYLVKRHRKDTRVDKPNDLRLFVNGVEKGKKVKNLQEIIDQLIGFDFDTFCAMMPGAGIAAAALTDSKIKELLEKLLQTEQLSIAYSAARDRLKVLESEQKIQSTLRLGFLAQLASLEKEVLQLRDLEKSFETQKADNVANRLQRITELEREIATCDLEITRRATLQSEMDAFKNNITSLQDRMVNQFEKPSRARCKVLEGEIAVHENTLRIIDHDSDTRQRKIASLGKLGPTCPTCESPITEEHVQACEREHQRQLENDAAKAEHAEKRLKLLRAELKDEISITAYEISSIRGQIDMNQQAVQELRHAITMVDMQVQLKAKLEKDLSREREALSKAQAEQHNFGEIFTTKALKAFDLADRVCQCLTKERELAKEHKLCSFWVDGFSPAGLRSYMLDYVTPILNDRAAYYSEVLTGGEMKVTFTTKTTLKKGGEKDKFQIMVEQKHGGDQYKGTSKGEKARADLVIAMALGDLATFRTAKQLPWRFLDEPFENIDDAGNEAVVQLLNDQKSRYKTVFVVTHKPAFKKLFNQRITVVKENGVSRLEHE